MTSNEPNNRYKTPFDVIIDIKFFAWCQKSRMKSLDMIGLFIRITTETPDGALKSHRVRLPQSQCQGKKKYPSWKAAHMALIGRRRFVSMTGGKSGGLDTIRVYKCPQCGSWHLGHRPNT